MVVIGCGTGRCGTLTLAKLLDGCVGFDCTHEARPTLSWRYDQREYADKLARLCSAERHGDVCSSYLPHLPRLFTDIDGLRVIVLRRPAGEVADSFEEWMDTTGPPRRHHWFDHQGVGWIPDPYDRTYPTYNIPDRRTAILYYANDYHLRTDQLMAAHPDSTLLIATSDLGDAQTQQRIFDFVGIPRAHQRPQPGLNCNSRKEFTVNEQTLTVLAPSAAQLLRRLRSVERRPGPGELTTGDVKRAPRSPLDDLRRAARLMRAADARRQRQDRPTPPTTDQD